MYICTHVLYSKTNDYLVSAGNSLFFIFYFSSRSLSTCGYSSSWAGLCFTSFLLFLSQAGYFWWVLTLFQFPNFKLGITHWLVMNGCEIFPTAFRTKGCEIQWIFLTGSRIVSMAVSLLWQLVATEALLFCGPVGLVIVLFRGACDTVLTG